MTPTFQNGRERSITRISGPRRTKFLRFGRERSQQFIVRNSALEPCKSKDFAFRCSGFVNYAAYFRDPAFRIS
jgi:hypothetical protein